MSRKKYTCMAGQAACIKVLVGLQCATMACDHSLTHAVLSLVLCRVLALQLRPVRLS
jgi:hypothetical protein